MSQDDEVEPDDWQKSYVDEAKRLVQQSRQEYEEMRRMSAVLASKLCEIGNHQTDDKLFFCDQCRQSFCERHGNIKKNLCENCQQMSLGID
jgi:hypothetical protein